MRREGDTVRGRVVYLLALVAISQSIYPITIGGRLEALLLYQALYSLMLVAGILVASDSRRHLAVTVGAGIAWLIVSVVYALDPTNPAKILLTYLVLIPFQGTVILVLLRYIFRAQKVTRDVLFAAVTVYLLLGALFVPIYGTLELLQSGSFVDNAAAGGPVFWQQLVYYSYVTLTTAGYGDLLPVSAWARSLATVEAVMGVLYLAILMARLVALYAARE